ncbi:hypothetical protein PM082_001075 [Marasmius tenuissimus]|nr:hypothetical protein PM082_001075 [Marasmius tenuissimus]
MIIFDDSEHASTSKPVLSQSGTLSPQSESAATEPARPDSPPPYSRPATPAPRPQQTTTASSSHSTGQEGRDLEAHGTHEYQQPIRKRRRKRWAKHASAVALVFLLFVMAWRFVLLEGWGHHIRRYFPSSQSHPHFGGHHGPPPPHDHGPIRKPSDVSEIAKDVATLKRYCTTNASWTPIARHPKEPIPFNSSSTTLHLPLDAYSLFLLTRIPNSSGRLQVLQHSIPHAPPQVFITAQHAEQHSLDSVSVCLMEKLPGVVGVGIFTDNFTIANESLDFDITLLLPVLRSGFMYDLETDLPKFSQNLNIDMPMDSVSLKSRGRPVIADLKANVVIIETSHGPVKGSIKASEYLSITTSHSPIDVNIVLENNDVTFTSVDLENTDSSINATISLVSQVDKGGKYDIEVSAPNTALNLTFPSAPSNPILQVKSTTTENPCHIILPPQYQGSFALTSLDGNSPYLNMQRIGAVAQDVESINDSRGEILRGSVPSQNEGTTAGWVNVTTSRAGNILVL